MAKRKSFEEYRRKSLKDRWLDDEVTVETWFERDRAFVGIQDIKTGDYLVEWWDDDVGELFEAGYFVDDSILRQARTLGRRFKESVIDYAVQVGVPAYKGPIRKRS